MRLFYLFRRPRIIEGIIDRQGLFPLLEAKWLQNKGEFAAFKVCFINLFRVGIVYLFCLVFIRLLKIHAKKTSFKYYAWYYSVTGIL